MKAIILAGGLGTHISEQTHLKPKPMVEIGGRPILWHFMKSYSAHGIHDFCGYEGYVIKEYFANRRRLDGRYRIGPTSTRGGAEQLGKRVVRQAPEAHQATGGGRPTREAGTRPLKYLHADEFSLRP